MIFPFLTICIVAVTVEPSSLNVSLNSIATFTCISPGSSHLFFSINGKSASDSSNAGRKLNEEDQDVINGTRYRNLTVEAIDINNNTNISCTSVNGSVVTKSEPALLKIQGNKQCLHLIVCDMHDMHAGLLASVGKLEWSFINGSSVLLSWTAPYTLDNVPITGYYINDNSGRLLNTTELSYILSATDPTDPCVLNNVSVAAINGAGIGEPDYVSFYYQKG